MTFGADSELEPDPGALSRAYGWVPSEGWRWATDLEVTPFDEEPHGRQMAALFTHSLGLLEQPLNPSDQWGLLAHRWGRERLERAIAEAPERAGAGLWLVPAGRFKPEGLEVAYRRIPRRAALKAFLGIDSRLPADWSEEDTRPAQIMKYASRFGWLGKPQLLVPSDGSPSIRGEPIMTWLEELSLLRRLSSVLKGCQQLGRSTEGRADRTRALAAQLTALFGAAELAGLSGASGHGAPADPSLGRVTTLISTARTGVRQILEPRLRGQFSAELNTDGPGPLERYVPASLAALLELELARQAVDLGRSWGVCPVCQTPFEVTRGGTGKTRKQFCSPGCRYKARDQSRPGSRRKVAAPVNA
ncbi:MAG: hypothetical protein ACREN4_06455 [Candidatus Dormibacteria bacterium]